ncbi:MAG: adenylate/guanylate cyclase domain-containing protein, partial [Nanoarchaeota archaeon]
MAKLAKAGVFAGLFLFFVFLLYVNAFSHVRGTLSDKLYGNRAPLEDIIIVAIDDASINSVGRWPWNRDIHAQLLQKVKDAKVIGIDVSFFEPSDNDDALKKTLASMQNVVLAAEVQQGKTYKSIFAGIPGYVNLLGDQDGVTRRFAPNLDNQLVPFAYQIYKAETTNPIPLQTKPYFINFVNKPYSFTMIPAKDVLKGNMSFAGKTVLIGATAPDLHDEYFVPTSDGVPMPGVEIHANIVQNFKENNFLHATSFNGLLLGILIAAVLGMFVLSRLRMGLAIPLTIGLLVLYGLSAIWAFNNAYLLLDLFFAPIALLAFTGTGIGMNYVEEKKKGAFVRDAFSKYVNKDLLAELLRTQQLKLGGEKRELTVFFSDIRGFTSISEQLDPEQLVHLLNEYLTVMTKIILQHQGTVDKFIGDAIMALWNAPLKDAHHAMKACRSAIEQVKALRQLQDEWSKRGVPVLEIGCGIHTGPAVVGNMGSEERFDYTAIGDTINLGSRIEGLTKVYGVSIIISEDTHAAIHDELPCRKLDAVKVKGKKKPVLLYHL